MHNRNMRRRSKNGAEAILEAKMKRISPKWCHTKPQIKEVQKTPSRVSNKWIKSIHRHNISKLQKTRDKENTLKEARGKIHLACKGTRITITSDSYQKLCKQEENGMKYLMWWEQKPTNLEFCILWNYP